MKSVFSLSVKSRMSLLLTVLLSFMVGCVKEKTIVEKEISPERQASVNMADSFATDSKNKQHVVIAKEALGKAFLLIPTMRSTGQNPDESYLVPLVVSFEKVGTQVAVFNLTQEQLYSTIASNRLMQTFRVVSEDEKSVVIDLGRGFVSLDLNPVLGYLSKDTLATLRQKVRTASESAFQIKDSFLKKVQLQGNTIFIEQSIRVSSQKIENKVDPIEKSRNVSATAKPVLVTSEETSNYLIELRPYIQNSAFKPKTFDKSQRVGFFINFSVQADQDEAIPQVTRWDIADSKGPILVRLHKGTPAEVRQSMQEGILYWNRVFNKKVLEISSDFGSGDIQADRSIFIYWIPWESAGFARAGFQADPMTGEIFRGQVFMTSSWYSTPRKTAITYELKTDSSTSKNYFSCQIDQAQLLKSGGLDMIGGSLSERAAIDTVRHVLAHEMGHALGLRHNYAASAATEIKDEALFAYRESYIKDEKLMTSRLSTSVMDYFSGLDTAINGQYIKENIMPYDVSAIHWGYFDAEPTNPKYSFCTDEHILSARGEQKEIYNCDQFDLGNNPFLVYTLSAKERLQNIAPAWISTLMMSFEQTKSQYSKPTNFGEFLASFPVDLFTSTMSHSALDLLYSTNRPNDKMFSIKTVIDSFFESLMSGRFGYEAHLNETIAVHFKGVGNYSGLLQKLVAVKGTDAQFFQKEIKQFFKKTNLTAVKLSITDEEFQLLNKKLIESAKKFDGNFEIYLLRAFPYAKTVYEMDPQTKVFKPTVQTINYGFELGDIKFISDLHFRAYQQALRQVPKSVSVQGAPASFAFGENAMVNEVATANRKLFSPSNSRFITANDVQLRTDYANKCKAEAIKNSLTILKMLNKAVPAELTADKLSSILLSLDWNQITGVTYGDFYGEVSEFRQWEENK